MTAYSTSATVAFSGPGLSTTPQIWCTVAPGSFETKIILIEYGMFSIGDDYTGGNAIVGWTPRFYRYSGGVASSGTSVTPLPLRQGSAAASATSRVGSSVSITGTQALIAYPSGQGSGSGGSTNLNYQFPFDLTVTPGSVFALSTGTITLDGVPSANNISGSIRLNVYFEELRLSWPY